MFFSSRVDPIESVPSIASGPRTATLKLGKAAAAVGLTGKAAALLRSLNIRRSMLTIPALGLVAAIGVIVAVKIAKDAKAKKAAEKTVPSAYPEGAVGLEPTPELKPYIAEER